MSSRRVKALLRIAKVFLPDPYGRHYGFETSKRARLRSYLLYSSLSGMLANGWVIDGWEDPTQTGGRPPRRYYQLTETGRQQLRALVAAAALDSADAAMRNSSRVSERPIVLPA